MCNVSHVQHMNYVLFSQNDTQADALASVGDETGDFIKTEVRSVSLSITVTKVK
jgi:hypothetical protein